MESFLSIEDLDAPEGRDPLFDFFNESDLYRESSHTLFLVVTFRIHILAMSIISPAGTPVLAPEVSFTCLAVTKRRAGLMSHQNKSP